MLQLSVGILHHPGRGGEEENAFLACSHVLHRLVNLRLRRGMAAIRKLLAFRGAPDEIKVPTETTSTTTTNDSTNTFDSTNGSP